MAELFGSFGTAMLIGIMCIYIVLVLLLHDFLTTHHDSGGIAIVTGRRIAGVIGNGQ